MSTAGIQAHAFYREVAAHGLVFTISDAGGYPAPMTGDGRRSMPFWSSRSRAERIVANVPAYAGFVVEEIRYDDFRDKWSPALEKDGLLVGLNWHGSRAVGYDRTPRSVLESVERLRQSSNAKG